MYFIYDTGNFVFVVMAIKDIDELRSVIEIIKNEFSSDRGCQVDTIKNIIESYADSDVADDGLCSVCELKRDR